MNRCLANVPPCRSGWTFIGNTFLTLALLRFRRLWTLYLRHLLLILHAPPIPLLLRALLLALLLLFLGLLILFLSLRRSTYRLPPLNRLPFFPPFLSRCLILSQFLPLPFCRFSLDDLLAAYIPSQRHLPKSSHHLVQSTLLALSSVSHDPLMAASQRQSATYLFLTAPRWLWPTPRTPGHPLPPHTRPRLIATRARQAMNGEWATLFESLRTPMATVGPLPAPKPADLLTEQECHHILRAAQDGRLSTAWRRLRSYGLLTPGPSTTAAVASKWAVPATIALPAAPPHLGPEAVAVLVTERTLAHAMSQLRSGSAPDALGWHHENVRLLFREDRFSRTLLALMHAYLTASLGATPTDLFNVSSLTALSKDASGSSARPIAVPTAFRKLIAIVLLHHWHPTVTAHVSPHQFGAGTRDGSLLFAASLRSRVDLPGASSVYIRTDVSNAFGSLHRCRVLTEAEALDPRLAQALGPWLARPSHAFLRTDTGLRAHLVSERGIPQGDPLSSFTYCLAIAQALRTTNALPDTSCLAYIDDGIICTSAARAGHAFLHWAEALRDLGLTLNADKTSVWAPDLPELPHSLSSMIPSNCFTTAGLKVCGLPLHASEADMTQAYPLGSAGYIRAFLADVLRQAERRMAMLEVLVETLGPHTEALHVALVLLRVNIYPSWVHFWRFLPPTFAQPLAADLDGLLLQTLQRLLGMALDAPAVLSILRLPMAEGGLGMLQQTLEAQIHFLSVAFALQALCADGPVSAPVFSPDHVADALNSLQALVPTGLDAVLYTGSRRAAPRRLRQTVYSDLGTAARTTSPWLTPPAYSLPPNSPIRPALQLRWALAWWPGHSSLFLPGPALRLAVQRHLGLNLFLPDRFCSYCPLRSGRVCGRPLGLSSTHVASCAQGPRLHRHHSLKGMWAQLLREAGFHVQDEQEVLLPEGGFRWADLVAIHHNGEQLALDVQCTGIPDFEVSALNHLLRQDDVKARRYGVAPQGRLPGGLTLHPLTHLSGIP